MDLPDHAELSALIDRWAAEAGVVGAAVAVVGPEAVVSAATGHLDTRRNEHVEVSTPFRIGSVTKVLTAHMVEETLVAQGLAPDTLAAAVLPSLRYGNGEGREGAAVTIAHLLHHTGGIDGDFWDGFGDESDALATYVDALADLDALFTPGAAWSYSNSGYVLLGRLLEVLAGRDFDDLLTEEVERLGLSSAVVASPGPPSAAANGHYASSDGPRPAEVPDGLRALAPAGTTLFANVEDLAEIGRQLLATPLPEVADLVTLPSVGGPSFTHQGPGWRGARWPAVHIKGHDGGATGQGSFLRTYPGDGLTVALLVNTVPNGLLLAHQVFAWVHDRLLKRAGPEALAAPLAPPTIDPDRYTGTCTRRDATIEVGSDPAGGLTLRSGPPGAQPAVEVRLTPVDRDRFIADQLFADTTGVVAFEALTHEKPDLLHAGPFTASRAVRP